MACHEANLDEQIYLFALRGDAKVKYQRMLEHAKGESFSLFLIQNSIYAMADVFNEKGLNLADYPIVIFGCADGISYDTKEKLNILSGYEITTPQLAIDLLEKMIKGEKVESICIEPKVTCEEKDGFFKLDLAWHPPTITT